MLKGVDIIDRDNKITEDIPHISAVFSPVYVLHIFKLCTLK